MVPHSYSFWCGNITSSWSDDGILCAMMEVPGREGSGCSLQLVLKHQWRCQILLQALQGLAGSTSTILRCMGSLCSSQPPAGGVYKFLNKLCLQHQGFFHLFSHQSLSVKQDACFRSCVAVCCCSSSHGPLPSVPLLLQLQRSTVLQSLYLPCTQKG